MVTDYGPSSDLRTINPSVVQDLTNFSGLKFVVFYDPITVVQDGSWFRLRSVNTTVGSIYRFLKKLFFCLFWLQGVTNLFQESF